MGDQLLIRAFDVGLGDCIYVRIPQARVLPDGAIDDFHILIDCGTLNSAKLTSQAIENLLPLLPAAAVAGKKRLDLLVVTHEHKDHMIGFDPVRFEDILIDHFWYSVAMDPKHPQAEQAAALHAFAAGQMRKVASLGLALDPELANLASLFSIDNDDALEALRVKLPGANGKTVNYVKAGQSSAADSLNLPIRGATLRVLAPEEDIDGVYLGEGLKILNGLQAGVAMFREASAATELPTNVSRADFRGLRARMMSNAFAFANLSGEVRNNTSVVLLIEWRGCRLLFVGDAEWNSDFKKGKKKFSWNVMWNKYPELLGRPLDFLKIGHHGSINATPWAATGNLAGEPARILDAILPLPLGTNKATAQAVVSTRRGNLFPSIPESRLLQVLGLRLASTRPYKQALLDAGNDPATLPQFAEREEKWLEAAQPWRTDLENALTGGGWVDVFVAPAAE